MRRYRGSDKPPGPTLSPPPYSRRPTGNNNPRSGSSSRAHTGKTPPVPFNSITESDYMMIQGSGTASSFIDPRTKKPIIPPAGRSVPKLKMSDLASSLGPLVDSQIIPDRNRPPLADKRVAAALKLKGISSKDMLTGFDDVVRVPDMRSINSKVAQFRKGKDSNSIVAPKPAGSIQKLKPPSGKVEEQNMRKLMGQLRDKYLEDMESQLGLAIERQPRSSLTKPLDQSDDDILEVKIPRPSTNAAEISARIDKVVREWATESQKLNKFDKNAKKFSQPKSGSGMSLINKSPQKSPRIENTMERGITSDKPTTSPTAAAPVVGKNKNLEKISNAFKKSLDPFTKRDVRELINVPEDDHVDKLKEEHEERVRAHEAVFKNAVVSSTYNNISTKMEREASQKLNKPGDSNDKKSNPNKYNEELAKSNPSNKKLLPFTEAIGLAKDDDKEMYNIIQDHLNYEMASGPPKISAPTVRNPPTQKPSKTNIVRVDAAEKTLQMYENSHKKLQNIVDSFTLKVEPSRRRYGHMENGTDPALEEASALPISSIGSQSTISTRRENAAAATSTVSRSVKTMGRASNVAQRLGTLMSRVALRNEAYDYEKQQETKQKSIAVSLDSPPSTQNSIRRQSTPSALIERRSNPYENSVERPNVPLGVTKLESTKFDKYVEEMKKVAQKAAESFEKFKDQNEETELVSFSEDEDSQEESEKSDDEAYAAAAAAAEIAAQQEQKRKDIQMRDAQNRKVPNSPRVKAANATTQLSRRVDAASSPRERGIHTGTSKSFNISSKTPADEQNDTDFKFIPEMSYTDQLMLQKLRKLKDKEGWGDVPPSTDIDITEVPDPAQLKSMRKRAERALAVETETGSMGPVSLNSILRARLNNNRK